MRQRVKLSIALWSVLATVGGIAWGAVWNSDAGGVVAGGYDVVAYSTEDLAVAGRAEWSAEHEGGTFYFSSAENRAAFLKDPARYAPLFGGYCAFGVADKSAKFPSDPRTFKIYEGQLLLFFNAHHEGQPINTKIVWNGNEKALFDQARKNWASAK